MLLGRDTRYSSPMLHSAVVSGLMSAGCEVLDLGVCPTPILQFCVKHYQAAGAISISGGHNESGWNSLTLISADGAFLEPIGGETVLDIFHAKDFEKRKWDAMGTLQSREDYVEPYFDALEKHLNVEAIRKAKFKVLIDPVGGAGCAFLEPFAKRLGLTMVPVNGVPSGYLAREAEPRPRAALQMASIIGHLGADAGFVLSSDMGRLSLVSEKSEPASEEYSFAVIANHVLAKTPGTVVTNACTTRTLDDVVKAKGASLVKTKVGQAHVVSALADEQGVLGGEGSGSVVLPAFSPAYDGFVMMGLVLEAMAEARKPLSKLLEALPRYHIVKKSVRCRYKDAYRALEALEKHWRDEGEGVLATGDGIRLEREDGWVQARVSRTEQMVRILSEAAERSVAQQRAEAVVRMVEQVI